MKGPLLQAQQALGLSFAPVRVPITKSARQSGTRIITITSGKGGVGKTTITANLASVFARLGRKTLVVDADLGLAGLDIALGVTPRFDLGDVLDGHASLDDTLVTGAFGVTLLPAAHGRAELASLGTAARASLLQSVEEVAARFDVVLVDTGAGIGATVLDFAAIADDVVLVVTPDPVALRDAYAMAKILERRSGRRELHVLANQLTAGTDGLAVHRRLEALTDRFLDLELHYAGAVRYDVAIAESCAHGVPFVLSEPSSSSARVLGELAMSMDARSSDARAFDAPAHAARTPRLVPLHAMSPVAARP
ncbi:MAG: MinD/ParA family protein [Sandaracinaceae bacterium]|nr:MinD/ParA family protein [Sandaracinaceae bacterium]